MQAKLRRKGRGFSLVELVIVIVIIGIIAAIAIPRVSRGSRGASESSLSSNLAVLRNAVELYASEHNGVYPGSATDGTAAAETADAFKNQLLKYTDIDGKAAATRDATHIYGPYLRKGIPGLPVGAAGVRGSSTVAIDTTQLAAGRGRRYRRLGLQPQDRRDHRQHGRPEREGRQELQRLLIAQTRAKLAFPLSDNGGCRTASLQPPLFCAIRRGLRRLHQSQSASEGQDRGNLLPLWDRHLAGQQGRPPWRPPSPPQRGEGRGGGTMSVTPSAARRRPPEQHLIMDRPPLWVAKSSAT